MEYKFSNVGIIRAIGGIIAWSFFLIALTIIDEFRIVFVVFVLFIILAALGLLKELKLIKRFSIINNVVNLEYFNGIILSENLNELLEFRYELKKQHFFSVRRIEVVFFNKSIILSSDPVFEQFLINHYKFFTDNNIKINID